VTDWLGWAATLVFAGSYFCRRPQALRRLQAFAALLWITYGALIHARPVVIANLLVAAAALWSGRRQGGTVRQQGPPCNEQSPSS
jgi:hypothetical protein